MRPDHENLTRSIHDWSTLQTQMLFIYDSQIPDGSSRGQFERHGEYSAWLVKEGWAQLKADGREVCARRGQWLFCLAQHIDQEFSKNARVLSVRIKSCWPQSGLFFKGEPLLCFESSKYPRLQVLAQRMLKEINMPNWQGGHPEYTFFWKTRLSYEAYLQHQTHLLEWTKEVTRTLQSEGWRLQVPDGIDPRLAHVLNTLDLMNFRLPFPGKHLSENSGLSPGQLNRLCKEAYGQTLFGYWQHRRIEQAKVMLQQKGTTIKETASYLGFARLSQFSVWFKRLTGKSPRRYALEFTGV